VTAAVTLHWGAIKRQLLLGTDNDVCGWLLTRMILMKRTMVVGMQKQQ
jgi:hypothetical protein